MDPRDFATDNCSIARTLSVVGEKWAFLVLREVFRGVRRFDDIRAVIGAPRQVLSDRLVALVDQGVLRRHPYREPGRRERHEYRLTDKGLDLYPVLLALLAWGDRHVPAPEGPALRAEHRDCGAELTLHLRCAAGHDVTALREVVARPGPGARLHAGDWARSGRVRAEPDQNGGGSGSTSSTGSAAGSSTGSGESGGAGAGGSGR